MLGFICFAFALIMLFFLVAFALVKLYEYGIRSWFIHTVLVAFVVIQLMTKPTGYEYSIISKGIFFTIAAACIFVTDSSDTSKLKSSSKSDSVDLAENQNNNSNSTFRTIFNLFLIYSIFSFFDDDIE